MKPYLAWAAWKASDIAREASNAIAAKEAVLLAVTSIAPGERTFANTIAALARAGEPFSDLEQTLQLLMNVHAEAGVRNAAQEASAVLDEANVRMEFDPALYRAALEWERSGERHRLDGPDGKLSDDMLCELRRMGFSLPGPQFEELKRNRIELKKLGDAFEKAINDWDDGILVTKAQLGGLPASYREGLTQMEDGRWRVTLRYPDFFPFMKLAHDEPSRRELMRRNLKKGGPENLARLADMIRLRQRNAELLGYPSHAAFVVEPRMAKTADTVSSFIESIAAKLKSGARQELDDLRALKRRSGNLHDEPVIGFHELAYWSELLRKERYAIDSETLKEYFPLSVVMEGMMGVYAELLGMTFDAVPEATTWHPDVLTYRASEATSGSLIGHFFLDLHPRDGKYGHAAAFPIRLGRTGMQHGMVALVCNFPGATPSNPSLLSHQEVETLFHEFGHLMHALLSCGSRYGAQNGLATAMDFVEAPSQLLEEWAWTPAVLKRITRHHETNAVIPDELITKLLASRHHMDANYYLAQAIMALYDFRMHSRPTGDAVEPVRLATLYRDLEREYRGMEVPDDALKAAGWSHMADYDAAYYGYLWSKVYAKDLFTRFLANPMDSAVGADYRSRILEPGSSMREGDLVRAFLGREPSDAAFLTALGIQ